MNAQPMTSLLFTPFEKGGRGGFSFRSGAEQSPEQIPLDPPFSKGESRAAESGAAKCCAAKQHSPMCRAAKQHSAKQHSPKCRAVAHHSAKCCAAKHHAAKHQVAKHHAAKHYIAASLLCESSLFPPLKKGGRGDLLFVPEQSENQGTSPLIPLFQRGEAFSSRRLQ